ncbi:MAG: Gfo/Idh/MocA family oxidoreductase [Candidatus Omnitrophica bacterium]|nr:Gfo/Idh/MocA family oxidoreductase [Candidatus Omnitrophota bacterium]
MKIYRAAIIGCGRIGSEFDGEINRNIALTHAGAYSLNQRTNLIAGCDSRREKLKAFQKKWEVNSIYPDYRTMLEKERIDILSVCTPPKTHWPIIRYASNFPLKAIYCEKPISDNFRDARKILRLCRTKKILLTINHQRRFDPFHRELKQKITEGFAGRVQQVNCYYTRGIFNTGTHILDLFYFLFGRPEWTMAVYSRNRSNFKNDPNLDVVIKFKNGPLAALRACDDSCYLIFEIDILGTDARIRLGAGFEYLKAVSGNNLLHRKHLVSVRKPPFKFKYGTISLTNGVEHIINCLEGKEKPLSSGEDAVSALETLESMCASASLERNTPGKRVRR